MSVFSAKSTFLQSQINGILSQPLTINDQTAAQLAPDILEHVLHEVVDEVNAKVASDFAAAYFPLAIQSVAQQIDQLYWEEAAPTEEDEEELSGPQISTSFATANGLETLPETWTESPEYAEKLQQLRNLHDRRDVLQSKMQQLKRLHGMLQPFKDPQQSIQPSLVTRDGPLAEELGKTRMLTTRLRAQATQGRLSTHDEGLEDDADDMMEDEAELSAEDMFNTQRKLQALLRSS